MATIDLIFFDAGGGHRAAATALKSVIEKDFPSLEPRLMHLRDVLDPVDVFRKVLRVDLQEIYNLMLRRGWTLGSQGGMRLMQRLIRLYHASEVRLLGNWWQNRVPDMAVSVVPNFNRALFDAWRRVAPGRPYVTVLTDLADFPPHFWMERQPQYFICGTPRAVEQARAMGHPAERIFLTSGMILQPSFYDLPPLDSFKECFKLGLDPNVPTGLVLFGGYGSKVMARIVERLEPLAENLQLILIAGRNAKLEQALREAPGKLRRHVVGFTKEVPYYMRMADFFIGKPGPGSLSEAVHLGLPCITVRNALTLPQERYNAEWLTENGYGIVLKSFRHIEPAVRGHILADDGLNKMRMRTAAAQNRAVFEIPAILTEILRREP
ncbi:MAG: glycosyltransferase [Bryobacteraceae bacterium]|jgi:1,2-diacylglycerol 3-beta-galactosyltransferase